LSSTVSSTSADHQQKNEYSSSPFSTSSSATSLGVTPSMIPPTHTSPHHKARKDDPNESLLQVPDRPKAAPKQQLNPEGHGQKPSALPMTRYNLSETPSLQACKESQRSCQPYWSWQRS
jgi:hypothetical protein